MENNLAIVKNKFKELPNNIEAEQAVIGSILVTNEIFDEINTIISNSNFYDPMHQKIFGAVESLIYKGMLANPITLKNYFEKDNMLNEVGGTEYLVKLTRFSGSSKQAIDYAKVIHEMYLRRELVQISDQLSNDTLNANSQEQNAENIIENTSNKGGGTCYNLTTLKSISELCKENDISIHLDGARIWNALIATNTNAIDYGKLFDTISVCFSKGLGCPIGSMLLGNNSIIKKAIRYRKALGGGMRQVGYIAAAANYALDNHVKDLAKDHEKAFQLGQLLSKLPYVNKVQPIETNIIIQQGMCW